MALNQQFKDLCARWREKANRYETGNDSNISDILDKFFSLYVVYNALYSQAYFYLQRQSRNRGGDAYKPKRTFPDKKAATNYILDIIGSNKFVDILENNETTMSALNQLRTVMDRNSSSHFSICIDRESGNTKPESDKNLLKLLNGRDPLQKGIAILTVIYEIRCNMFHGRKGVDPIQKALLLPIITILEKVVEELYKTLSEVS